jgi:hypothetical protein
MDYVSLAAVIFSCFALIGVMLRDNSSQFADLASDASTPHPSGSEKGALNGSC